MLLGQLGHAYGLTGRADQALAVLSRLHDAGAARYVSPRAPGVTCPRRPIDLGRLESSLSVLRARREAISTLSPVATTAA